MAKEFVPTPYQLTLLKGYPEIDFLGSCDPAEINALVKADETGDTLFAFLWRELNDDCDSPEEARHRLERAINEIEGVLSRL